MDQPPNRESRTHEDDPISSFARELLQAFDAAERYAKERGGVTAHADSHQSGMRSRGGWTSTRRSTSFIATEKARKQLHRLFQRCIRDSVDDLCDVLCVSPALANAPRQRRIDAALAPVDMGANPLISDEMMVSFLEDVTINFHEQHDSLGRALSTAGWVSDWNPDWRTQNLVWTLLKRLGSLTPPEGVLTAPYQGLKESAFACLFQGDYLSKTRRKCSFKESLLKYLPYPGKWGADLSWFGSAVFISMPIASLAHSWEEGNRLITFWSLFAALLTGVSIALLLLFASYRSRYSNALLDRAAKGTPYERGRRDGHFTAVSIRPTTSGSMASISTARSTQDNMEVVLGTTSSVRGQSDVQVEQVESEDEGEGRNGSILQLYQASMFVERIYGSTYMDETWMIGMTEQQLNDAVSLVLQTAGTLGRQTSAFSFTSLTIATRGVPDPELFAAGTISSAVRGAQVTFAIFSFLGSLAFSCGMVSAILSDLIVRQMAFTQVKADGTIHEFVKKFGFFIRLMGTLNSCAGLSLMTGVVVLLLSIFRVHPVAVFPLSAAWLILGSITIDSFFTKYHFWNMSEIINDVGSVLDDPDIQSPSPITGSMQSVSRKFKQWFRSARKKKTRRKESDL